MILGLSPQAGRSNKHMRTVYTQMCFDWIQAGAPWLAKQRLRPPVIQSEERKKFPITAVDFVSIFQILKPIRLRYEKLVDTK